MIDDNGNPVNPQAKKFEEAARAAECDEDEGRWEERLRHIARAKVDKPK